MNPDSENFDSLRRLLALKRHEQPPPGYFNRFSRDVIARIKAGESGGETSFELPFFQRLFALFDVKPVFAGAFGMAMCALLISGVIAQDKQAPPGGPAVAQPVASPVAVAVTSAGDTVFPSSTNAVPPSLFDQFPAVQAQQVKYWVPSRN